MNIRDLQSSASRADRSRSTTTAGGAAKVTVGQAAQGSAELQNKGVQDSVEISHAGRTALAEDQQARLEDVEVAKKALLGIPPLSQERVEDILKRIQEGYFSPPEMIKQMAEKTAEALFGKEVE